MIRLTNVEVYGDVDFDIEEILDQLSDDDYHVVRRFFEEDRDAPEMPKITDQLTDPVILLETLVWLRKNGYTVEPKEELYSTPNHTDGGA